MQFTGLVLGPSKKIEKKKWSALFEMLMPPQELQESSWAEGLVTNIV